MQVNQRKIEINDWVRLRANEIKTNVKNSPRGTPKSTMGDMVKPGTKYKASQSKATFTITENRPSVTMLIGRVSSLRIGLRMRLIKVRTTEKSIRATQSVYEILGKNQAKMKIASKVLIKGRNIKHNNNIETQRGQVD